MMIDPIFAVVWLFLKLVYIPKHEIISKEELSNCVWLNIYPQK